MSYIIARQLAVEDASPSLERSWGSSVLDFVERSTIDQSSEESRGAGALGIAKLGFSGRRGTEKG